MSAPSQMLTANRLIDGEAVWYASGRGWIERLEGADLASDKTDEARLDAVGKAAFAHNEVVDVDLIDVEVIEGAIVPIRLRERIRAAGPTNRTDLGKQAAGAPQAV